MHCQSLTRAYNIKMISGINHSNPEKGSKFCDTESDGEDFDSRVFLLGTLCKFLCKRTFFFNRCSHKIIYIEVLRN